MKIIVVGGGKTGESVIRYASAEGHDVTVIDTEAEVVESLTTRFDVAGVIGNGGSRTILSEAGAENADLLVASAYSDELNLLVCLLSKRLGTAHTVARIRNPEYYEQRRFLSDNCGVDLIINPELEAAQEIVRMMQFPAAVKMEAFAGGRVDMAEIILTEANPLCGLRLMDLRSRYAGIQVLICAVRRGDTVESPNGTFALAAGDRISLVASHADLSAFFRKLGIAGKPIKNVMLVGGSRVAYYLSQKLVKLGIPPTVIERDEERCRVLAEQLPKSCCILQGDGTDSTMLLTEGLEHQDAFVALTDHDETNIVLSMFARTHGVEKNITKISRMSLIRMMPDTDGSAYVSPRYLAAVSVLRYLRGLSNSRDRNSSGEIRSLYKLIDNRVEAIEFNVGEGFAHTGIPFASSSLTFRRNLLVACIVRGNDLIFPNGASTLEKGDRVVVVTTDTGLSELNDILA
jgi:trk system potassium uptake protein TrkA